MDALDYDFARDVWCVFGLPIDNCDLSRAEAAVRDAVLRERHIVLSTPNVNWVVAARADPQFRRTVIDSELCTADGMPLVWAARLLGLPFTERVGGSNLTENLLDRATERPLSIFLFGGEEGVAARACERINARGGGLKAVGCLNPGHGSAEAMSRADTIATINATAPDILLVAVGARKGQAWIERNRHQLNARVISNLGATVNFLAGNVARAPLWMQRSGLEWIWRIVQEPKLIGRYATDGGVLVWLVVTRLLPYWALLKSRRRRAEVDAPLAIETRKTASNLRLTLCGTATRRTAEPVIPALKQAVLAEGDIILDLAGVEFVDSAFIALLMIVEKHVAMTGKELRIEGISPYVKRLFRYNCAEFLLVKQKRHSV